MSQNEYELEVDAAAERLGFAGTTFSKVDRQLGGMICRQVMSLFVTGNPRAWWLGFKEAQSSPYTREEWPSCVLRSVPLDTSFCWLVLESDSKDYPVYRVAPSQLSVLLGECSFFEYYLVDLKFKWIIADTDHNAVVVAGRGDRLAKAR